MTDKVLNHYTELCNSVSDFVVSLYTSDESLGVADIKAALWAVAEDFGIKADEVVQVLKDNNDIPAQADKLIGDDLVYVRITGSLFAHVSNIASIIYDIEQGLHAVGAINEMIGTILILEEAGYA